MGRMRDNLGRFIEKISDWNLKCNHYLCLLNHFHKLFFPLHNRLTLMSPLVPGWQDKDHGMLPKPPLQNAPLNPTVGKQQNHHRDALNVPWSDPDALV